MKSLQRSPPPKTDFRYFLKLQALSEKLDCPFGRRPGAQIANYIK